MNRLLDLFLLFLLLAFIPLLNLKNVLDYPKEAELETKHISEASLICLKKNNFFRIKVSHDDFDEILRVRVDCSTIDDVTTDIVLGLYKSEVWSLHSNQLSIPYEDRLKLAQEDSIFNIFFFWLIGGGMYILMQYSKRRKLKRNSNQREQSLSDPHK